MILLTIPVVLLVDDFIHDVILVPIAYYIWLGRIIAKALPESCFLTLLIILSLVIIAPSLRRNRRSIWRPKNPPVTIQGEVAQWEQRLRLLSTGAYTEQRVAYHIGHLVLQLLAYEERLPIRAVIYNLETGTFDMPENVRLYILNGIGMGSMKKSLSVTQRIQQWLKQILPTSKNVSIVKQYEDILPTIQFIESKLQIIKAGSDVPPVVQKIQQSEVSYVE
jgi:hypothetical protein